MCVTVTVVTGHSVALNRRSHLFSTMSSLHDVLVHDKEHIWLGFPTPFLAPYRLHMADQAIVQPV
jgi:hypothetical protein